MLSRIQAAMKKADGGFTLVELIVVVLIIGVLAAIAVPVFTAQTANAKANADRAAVQAARTAVASYILDADSPVAEPTITELGGYGFPAEPLMTVKDVSGTTGAYTVTLASTASASKMTCVATATTATQCATPRAPVTPPSSRSRS